jgi:hypothetical protein
MRDKTHEEFVVKWASFVRDNPNKWQNKHTEFINSQILMNKKFLNNLSRSPGGKNKIIELYNIKNVIGYEGLLKKKG